LWYFFVLEEILNSSLCSYLNKKMVKIIFSFEKRHLYFLLFAIGIFALVGIATSYNSGMRGGNPAVMGHCSDEVMVNVSGNLTTLQAAIDNGTFGGSWKSMAGGIYYNDGNVGIGTATPSVALEVAQNKAIKVGNAFLSSGTGGNFMHLATNEWFNGVAWQETGPGALLQFTDQNINLLSHNGAGVQTQMMTVTPSGVSAVGSISATGAVSSSSISTGAISAGAISGSSLTTTGNANVGGLTSLSVNTGSVAATGSISAGVLYYLPKFDTAMFPCDDAHTGAMYFDTNIGNSANQVQLPCVCVYNGNGGFGLAWVTFNDINRKCD
jgi:hypothetical protein